MKRRVAALAVGVLVGVASSCMEGQRPVLIPAAEAADNLTGDTAVDTVLRRLEVADTATFEARFEIRTLLGNTVTQVEVAQDGQRRRAVRLGEVLYRDGTDRDPVTCNTSTGVCQAGLDDALIAPLMVTRTFYSTSAVARLAQTGRVASGRARLEDAEIAGIDVVCVTVPVPGGEPRYCATPQGVLARYLGADTHITLTDYRTELTDGLAQRLFSGSVSSS